MPYIWPSRSWEFDFCKNFDLKVLSKPKNKNLHLFIYANSYALNKTINIFKF